MSLRDRLTEAKADAWHGGKRDYSVPKDFDRIAKNLQEFATLLEKDDPRWPKKRLVEALRHTSKNVTALKKRVEQARGQ